MKTICDIYRSHKKPDMYLYVAKDVGLEGLPEALLQQFGKAELALTLALSPEKKLARADVRQVLSKLAEQGYYLQLPPSPDAEMQAVNLHNDKLAKQ